MSTRILVVDDEQDFTEFVSFNLRQHGYQVMIAFNGLDALLQARRHSPDLVLLDLMMEGVDGYSVCESLRRQPSTRTLPIIILTAAGGMIARLNSLASGANEFITKPVTPRNLVRCIEAVLLSHEQAREKAAHETDKND